MRLKFVDNARAIAIILVVLAHTDGIPDCVEMLIYSFHMPAFFFISGLLTKDSKLDKGMHYFLGLMYKLIVPYIFFGTISLLYSLFHDYISGESTDIHIKVAGILYGNCDNLFINRTLWFFPCLFLTSTLFYALYKIMNAKYIVPVVFLCVFLFFIFYYKRTSLLLPWNVDSAVVALLFYSCGNFLSKKNILRVLSTHNYRFVFVSVMLILWFLLLILSNANGKVDMAYVIFKNPVLFGINAFIGIAALLMLSSLLPETKIAKFLSVNTIVIFPMHPLIFSLFTGIAVYIFNLPHSFQDNIYTSIFYTTVAIILCFPVSFLLTKYLPITIGKHPGNF